MRTFIILFLNFILIPYKICTGKSIFSLCDPDVLFAKRIRVCRLSKVRKSKVGKYTSIANGNLIINANIGSFCSISSNCFIGMANHPYKYVSTSTLFSGEKNKFHKKLANLPFADYKTTIIGNDVWIGHGAMVKTGVKIGDGAVVGAGAVVTRNVPPYAIVAGVPAKIIKFRFDDKVIRELIKTQWWNKSIKQLQLLGQYFEDPENLSKKVLINNLWEKKYH